MTKHERLEENNSSETQEQAAQSEQLRKMAADVEALRSIPTVEQGYEDPSRNEKWSTYNEADLRTIVDDLKNYADKIQAEMRTAGEGSAKENAIYKRWKVVDGKYQAAWKALREK